MKKNVLVDNYSELPWDSFDEISSKVNTGDIDLGLFIDTSRQWLTKSPDAPRISYYFLNLLLIITTIIFPVFLAIITWNYVSWFFISTLFISLSFFLFGRRMNFSTKKQYYNFLIICFILMLVGFFISNYYLIFMAMAIFVPNLLNEIQYIYSSHKARKIILNNKKLFKHFFESGELGILEISEGIHYYKKRNSPFPPDWFYKKANNNTKAKNEHNRSKNDKVSYYFLIKKLINDFRELKDNNISDIFQDTDYKDITNDPRIKEMEELIPKPAEADYKYFSFISANGLYNEMNFDILNKSIANARLQIFFNSERQAQNNLIKFKKLVEEISNINFSEENLKDDPYFIYYDAYDFFGITKNNLFIGLRREDITVSIAITDMLNVIE